MNRSHPLLLVGAAIFITSLLGCAKPEPVIEKADVERIVSTLAADDMMGRRTFTPGIEKAAEFLSNEFNSIGLEKLDGLSGYKQSFSVYSLKQSQASVSLNGKAVNRSDFFITSSTPDLQLSLADVNVVVVGAADDMRTAYNTARSSDGATLMLINTQQSNAFARYQQSTSRASNVIELGSTPSIVAVLTNATSASALAASATYDVDELGLGNVAGMISGKRANEYVLFSAHYDHIGVRTVAEGDSIANGANDDASGVAAVVELARYFKAKDKPERTLLFAAFTAEEMGGYGSRYFSSQLDPDNIVAMFNIEMIGKPAVSGPNTAWITGFDRSDFGAILQRAVEGTEYEFYADPYPAQNLFYRSDNATLARLGVPAHSISTTPIDVDPDYHQVSDHVETLDLDHMTNTIRAIAAGAATIVSGQETPTRVDPQQM